MTSNLHKLSDRLFAGEISTREPEHHPFAMLAELAEVSDSVAFYKHFVNLAAVRTEEGLVLIDTGPFQPGIQQAMHEAIRAWSGERIHTAIYTHGHVDHAYGLPPYLRESAERGWARPEIIGHTHVRPRMERYIETAGYNSIINSRQFGLELSWPTDPIYPTTSYDTKLRLAVGGQEILLFHARGETDDHTWVFLPGERVLCTGDLFIWAVPNAGNPQKVQRYCIDWSRALREMAALAPTVLLPGHGLLIEGEARVRNALLDTADYLESLYEQTLVLMNEGATVDEIIHSVKPPAELSERPYLQPVYDEPEFIVRNIYRCLGGWYDGTPSELKPAPRQEQARAISELAGGTQALLARARALAADGNLRLACHIVDWAAEAEPESREVWQLRAEVYELRTEAEPSTMSRGIFGDAARRSRAQADGD
ncbi:MAG: MBL fold metallo-hydrolase [Myxococcales bacterium]|nr:MBL fold metallo-hydrolase [Myxococcales bacterium]